MQYRSMPGSDDKLSVLGYGCMRFPTRMGAANLIDKDAALRQLKLAIEGGVNYLDTAYPYHMGASETFLGEYVLSTELRSKVNIATKLPCMTIRKKEAIRPTFQKQLQKLQVDMIDYYLLHSLNGQTWDLMVSLGIMEFMDSIRASGQVRKMGFSFHGMKDDFIRITDAYDWDFAQVQFNILDEQFQAGIEGIRHAHAKGMGVIVMEPLRGGSIVGKIPHEVQKIYKTAEVKREPVDWALRWILNHPEVTMVLSGMNQDEHIRQNIDIVSDALPGGMTEQEERIIADVRGAYDDLLQVGCTGCAYCMPCPAGIDIPAAFKNLNDAHMFSKSSARIYHAAYMGIKTADGEPHWTSSCIDCGKCEAKCPQSIPVRTVFKQVQRELEGPLTKTIAGVGRVLLNKKVKPDVADAE
ncbi:MAG: aldo/keto reductase [Coriobacteriia bacterium]|nr:aldo/keto reductase [Coriobacteriia bacterium]MBN2822326.1 aldo/keto reductase [Coriobacteriia bacterium]